MKKTIYVTKEKMNGAYLNAKNRMRMLAGRKKAGVSTLVILLLLVVVSVQYFLNSKVRKVCVLRTK